MNPEVTSCPVCGEVLETSLINKIGISEIEIMRTHIHNGVLGDVFKIADIAMKHLQPDKVISELQQKEFFNKLQSDIFGITESFQKNQSEFLQQLVNADEGQRQKILEKYQQMQEVAKNEYDKIVDSKISELQKKEEERVGEYRELNKTLQSLQEKLFGTGIGTAGEVITILDLKKVCPGDEFSEIRAVKHGTDIVATVVENAQNCGKVSISVKYQQKWNAEFITQLEKNMQEDKSRWGILVSKVFPREALNTNMWTCRDTSGKMLLMVKPEYAPLAYCATRQVAVHWKSVEHVLETRKAIEAEENRINHAVVSWISGEEFMTTIKHITDAIDKNREIDENLLSMQTYLREKVVKIRKDSDAVSNFLDTAIISMNDLKKLLEKPKGQKLSQQLLISESKKESDKK